MQTKKKVKNGRRKTGVNMKIQKKNVKYLTRAEFDVLGNKTYIELGNETTN